MADNVCEDQVKQLMEAFARFDTDNDGLIGVDQLRRLLHSLGQNPTDAELQDLAYSMDTNDSGDIDLPEFLQLMLKRISDTNIEEDITEAFKVFDKDGNGLISARELKQVMANLGEVLSENEVESLIEEADIDGDGCINYTEFFGMVCNTMHGDNQSKTAEQKRRR